MDKVIFLDFDGVLNNAGWMKAQYEQGKVHTSFLERHYGELDPAAVKLVSDLAVETEATIVVSSSWRHLHPLHELCEILAHNGMDERVLPRSITPNSMKGFRGEEVRMWLQVNPDYRTHVIFDDDGDFYPGQPLVQTSWEVGLLPSHVEVARKILLNIQ